ncbi:hypothetical protein N8I87_39015 [Streptomyces sp. HUAS TT20]|nr:hypothetical protein N8I87_39015 [Streptomyces sp. HUAS 15-9]
MHEWTFTEDGDGVMVRTRESWAGAPLDADRDNLAAALDESLGTWLDALKKAAKQRPSGAYSSIRHWPPLRSSASINRDNLPA